MFKKTTLITTALLLSLGSALAATTLTSTEQTDMVTAHNTWRAEVGTPPLKWSATLADSAQAWADKLKATQGCKMVHSQTAGVGENLYWASAIMYSTGATAVQPVTSTQVTNSWGNEKKGYTYATNTCAAGKVCGHYTQVVWKSTTDVGCGKAICADKTQVWACQYTPAGNYVGQKPY